MLKISSFLTWVAFVTGLFLIAASVNAQQMYKCKVNGTVTYQQDPCPAVQFRKPPSVQELNAAEKKRRETVKEVTPEKPTAVEEKVAINPQRSEKLAATPANPPTASTPSSSFSCDGRQYCS